MTPPSSPSPAPPEDSPTADDLLEYAELVRSGAKPPSDDHLTRLGHLYPRANSEIANPVARGLQFVKEEEPSLICKARYDESLGGDHFWPISEGPSSVAIKRDEPDRMPDAPISGDEDNDEADGTIQCVALLVTGGRR